MDKFVQDGRHIWTREQLVNICSDHFESNDYMHDLKAEFLSLSPKLKLKDDVESHINLWI